MSAKIDVEIYQINLRRNRKFGKKYVSLIWIRYRMMRKIKIMQATINRRKTKDQKKNQRIVKFRQKNVIILNCLLGRYIDTDNFYEFILLNYNIPINSTADKYDVAKVHKRAISWRDIMMFFITIGTTSQCIVNYAYLSLKCSATPNLWPSPPPSTHPASTPLPHDWADSENQQLISVVWSWSQSKMNLGY